jgi:hypothetical protein
MEERRKMKDRFNAIKGLASLIEIVSEGEWKAESKATMDQAEMYISGIRDVRIADVVFIAVSLAGMIYTNKG